jgi:DNA-binding response OmpR family regulator
MFDEPPSNQACDRPDGHGLHILLVEDDVNLAMSLAWWLGLHGYAVRVARDGPAALRMIEASPPDVLVLDIGLPGLDGYGVAEQLREQVVPRLPKAPLLIALTGRAGEADRCRSEEAGIHLHLTKPLDGGQLLAVLDRFKRVIR